MSKFFKNYYQSVSCAIFFKQCTHIFPYLNFHIFWCNYVDNYGLLKNKNEKDPRKNVKLSGKKKLDGK